MTPTRVRTLPDGEEIVSTEAPLTRSGESDPRELAVARRTRALWETGAKNRGGAATRKPLPPRDAD